MKKTPRNRTRPDQPTHQISALARAERLTRMSREDPASVAKEAAAYAAERRYAWETRGRPGYASAEAGRPFEPETRLIRAADRRAAASPRRAPPARPSYEEMRAQADAYPDMPGEVREYQRRKREQRRRTARVNKREGSHRKKK